VTAPPDWLDRLLGVLLDNACRYSPEGGSVRVVVDGDGGRASVTVDDAGPGIDPEQRSRIFDRFHRATDQPGGAGLGLSIADAIVRATGGRWKIGSSASGGASMSVSWARTLTGARSTPPASPSTPAMPS
jgi:signal transduction histidine kinase